MSSISPLSPNLELTFWGKVQASCAKMKTRFANIGQYSTAFMTLKALWNKKEIIAKWGPENPFIKDNRKATVTEFFQSIRGQIQAKLEKDINTIIDQQTLRDALNAFDMTSNQAGIRDLPIDKVKTLVKLARLQMKRAKGDIPDGAKTVKYYAKTFMNDLLWGKKLDSSYLPTPEDLKKLAVIKRAFPEEVKQFWIKFKNPAIR